MKRLRRQETQSCSQVSSQTAAKTLREPSRASTITIQVPYTQQAQHESQPCSGTRSLSLEKNKIRKKNTSPMWLIIVVGRPGSTTLRSLLSLGFYAPQNPASFKAKRTPWGVAERVRKSVLAAGEKIQKFRAVPMPWGEEEQPTLHSLFPGFRNRYNKKLQDNSYEKRKRRHDCTLTAVTTPSSLLPFAERSDLKLPLTRAHHPRQASLVL